MIQENGRLAQIVKLWPLLCEQGKDCILSLALALLSPADFKALSAAGRALAQEGPDNANATC